MGGPFRGSRKEPRDESRSAGHAGVAEGSMRIPISTYRLQFNREFRFADARGIVDYLHELGISDLYASPILKARPGSVHGYDVTDPTQLNPEIGTVEEFDELSDALRANGMGFVLDIVPNHMAASLDNPWWFDVLEKGEESPYASFFDVNWETKKVLLPILGRPYGEVLDNQELVLRIENGRAVHSRRSEEHTSELQSPCNLVCRLLLEKKKITS